MIDALYEYGPLTIQDLLTHMLERLAETGTAEESGDDSDDDVVMTEDNKEDVYGIDDYDLHDAALFGVKSVDQTFNWDLLQRSVFTLSCEHEELIYWVEISTRQLRTDINPDSFRSGSRTLPCRYPYLHGRCLTRSPHGLSLRGTSACYPGPSTSPC